MRPILYAALLSSGAAFAQEPAPPAPSANTVVEFVHPEKFIDASDRGFGAMPSDRVLNGLRTALVALGTKYLDAGQSLKIDITDIDLAGRFDPMLRPAEPLRVLRDADWPRISLHYELKQDGDVVRQGDERITDMNYLRQQAPHTGEPLFYEKRMLADWFARTFARRSSQ